MLPDVSIFSQLPFAPSPLDQPLINQAYTTLAQLAQGKILHISLIFARIGTIAFFIPGVGERFISVRVRLSVAIGLAILIVPSIEQTTSYRLAEPALYVSSLLGEIIAGLFFGLLIRTFIFTLQLLGTIISQNLSLAQLFTPQFSSDAETPFGTLALFAAIAFSMAMGFHIKFVGALIGSYTIVPLGGMLDFSVLTPLFVERVDNTFSFAVQLAMPFILAGVTYNLMIGAANRAMPQMLATLVGAPAISLAGLVIFAIMLPIILFLWERELSSFLQSMTGIG